MSGKRKGTPLIDKKDVPFAGLPLRALTSSGPGGDDFGMKSGLLLVVVIALLSCSPLRGDVGQERIAIDPVALEKEGWNPATKHPECFVSGTKLSGKYLIRSGGGRTAQTELNLRQVVDSSAAHDQDWKYVYIMKRIGGVNYLSEPITPESLRDGSAAGLGVEPGDAIIVTKALAELLPAEPAAGQ